MENAGYLLAAFTIAWLALFGYIFVLSRRQQHLRRDIDLLKEVDLSKETPDKETGEFHYKETKEFRGQL